MNFKFNYKGKTFNIDVKECRSIFSKASGLMFRKKSKPLLFIFKKLNNQPIHSFFCVPFIAIWFNGNKIVYVKLVNLWKISEKPKVKFDKILEIPTNNHFFKVLKNM
jgi:uncharacterized membrane protein (UPF0127 family)